MVWRISLPLLILLATAASGEAAKVKVWHQHGQASFDKAKFNRAVVSSEGVLTLSRGSNALPTPVPPTSGRSPSRKTASLRGDRR